MYEHLGFKLVNGKLVNIEPQVVVLDEVPYYAINFHQVGSHVEVVKPYYNDGRHGIIIELMFEDKDATDKSGHGVKYRIKYDDDQFPLVEGVWEHDDLKIID